MNNEDADINNNGNITETIRKESNKNKLEFVKNVILQKNIPEHSKPLRKCNARKIFYGINDEKREWIFFHENTFFCAYCLCFSLCDDNRFVLGIKYEKGCRIADNLNRHDSEKNHIRAKNIFGKLASDSNIQQNPSRNWLALKAVVKIIIFIATHGK